jgi:DNA (cytosine-5)-methyltransferase 1
MLPLTVGSLFSGIGGLDLGLERAGWAVRWQVESDDFCCRVLAKHWPRVARHGDIVAVDPARLAPVTLVCGGFPCQPVSVAGKRRAQADERWLWPEFSRIIRALRPPLVLVENVPGLLEWGIREVLGDLAGFGFDAEWHCFGADALGATQHRERVWILANSHDARLQGPIWLGQPDAARWNGKTACSEPLRSAGGYWPPGPYAVTDIPRMADGPAHRVDRLRGLGNAVVPQVAEWLGWRLRALAEASDP